ncbi:uncharacterized protein LOC144435912 [Glandiceps talaboti]
MSGRKTQGPISDLIIRIMVENDVEEATQVLSDAFTGREPLTVCLGIKVNDDIANTKRHCEKAAQDGVSMVAVDTTQSKIVGVATTFTMKSAEEKDDGLPPLRIFRPILALLNRLVRCFMKHPEYGSIPTHKIIHFQKLGVHKDYAGHGIGTMLRKSNTQLARSKGCEMAIATATAPATHKMYTRLGFTELYEIKYEEFEFEGRRPFESVTECNSAKLFYKPIV